MTSCPWCDSTNPMVRKERLAGVFCNNTFFHPPEAFEIAPPDAKPRTFVQYKGTDLCMDWSCSCTPPSQDFKFHIDAYFAGVLKCPDCGAVWQLPQALEFTRLPDDYEGHVLTASPPDDEHTFMQWELKPNVG